MPAQLALEVRRIAEEKKLTMSRALVTLAERGVEAERAARAKVESNYQEFMSETDPARKTESGKELIMAIFGKDAVAEDPLF